jgi:hypothetical protein
MLCPFELIPELGKLLASQFFELLPLLGPTLGQRFVRFFEPALGALEIGLLSHTTVQQADEQQTRQRSNTSHMPREIHGATLA